MYKLIRVGVAGLLLPPLSFFLIYLFENKVEFPDWTVLPYIFLYFGFPFAAGIYLLIKFILTTGNRPYPVLVLSILNIISPFWLFFFMITLAFRGRAIGFI